MARRKETAEVVEVDAVEAERHTSRQADVVRSFPTGENADIVRSVPTNGDREPSPVPAAVPDNVFIYVGETIPGTVLSFGKLYRGELPEAVKGLLSERYPEAAPLLIDVRGLPDFSRRARVKGSYEYGLMKRLSDKIRSERSV